jgi:hypothetical protein
VFSEKSHVFGGLKETGRKNIAYPHKKFSGHAHARWPEMPADGMTLRRFTLMNKEIRGQRAEALLKDKLLNESLNALEEHYTDAWRRCRTLTGREDAHRYITLIGKFREDLASVVLTGTLEGRRKAELEGRKPFWK